MPFLKHIDPFAQSVGAVNTVCLREDGLYGYNTDVIGFLAMLDRMNVQVRNRDCVILGASGGAAKAAIEALRSRGARMLYLVTRAPSGRLAAAGTEWIDYSALHSLSAELLVNCTPVGMYPNTDVSPLSSEILNHFGAVADMIYNPLETKLLHDARMLDRPAENGLYMLVGQAIAAQEIWQGKSYPAALTDTIFSRLIKAIQRGDYV